ncbi:MAG: LpxL/LpxP family acyltransferase [Gammaproteobacteria bacterium]
MNEKSILTRYWHPRHWPVWAAVGLVYVASRLPYRIQPAFGGFFGALFRWSQPRRRTITRANIDLCFPNETREWRKHLVRAHFHALGMGLIEVVMAWSRADCDLPPVQIEGLAYLEQALEKGHGAILLTGHFTMLELGARFVNRLIPVGALFRPANLPLIDALMRRARAAQARVAIPRDDLRGLIKALSKNIPVWYASDQGYTGKHAGWVPFFGIPAPTNLALSRLAEASDAPVVPFFIKRLNKGRGYAVTLRPALESFPGADPLTDAQRIHALLEVHIREAPAQYLWSHDRFKRHPRNP